MVSAARSANLWPACGAAAPSSPPCASRTAATQRRSTEVEPGIGYSSIMPPRTLPRPSIGILIPTASESVLICICTLHCGYFFQVRRAPRSADRRLGPRTSHPCDLRRSLPTCAAHHSRQQQHHPQSSSNASRKTLHFHRRRHEPAMLVLHCRPSQEDQQLSPTLLLSPT